MQGTAIDGLHGALKPNAVEMQARSARSSEAPLHTLGSAGGASGRAQRGDARPQAPASDWDMQQRTSDTGCSTERCSGGAGGSGARLHVLQGSPPRAPPSDTQAGAPPQGAGGTSMAASLGQVRGGRETMVFGSLMGGREVDTLAEERDGAGGKGCTPFPGVCVGMDGQEQAGVSISANGDPQNRTAAAPGQGAAANGGVRRRRGPNPFSPAGQ